VAPLRVAARPVEGRESFRIRPVSKAALGAWTLSLPRTSYALNPGNLSSPDKTVLSGFSFTACHRYFSWDAQLLYIPQGWELTR
jgi:hypothetical protein